MADKDAGQTVSNAPDQGDQRVDPQLPAGKFFEIRVRGYLNNKWSDWLEGMEVCLLDNGEMVLCGRIADQAALMGLLNKLNRLNLTLLSVNQAEPCTKPAGAETPRRSFSRPMGNPGSPGAVAEGRDEREEH
jgi:hypothetical protein